MKAQAFNPYLNEGNYVPDGEPHVFNDRVYIYGSHDKEGGKTYCEEPYDIFSASINDLSSWKKSNVSYDIPERIKNNIQMYASDCCMGNDGKYYLYYCISGVKGANGYGNPISVAVSENPDGPFKYYGFVKDEDGNPFTEYVTFDPAVINDDGIIRLYYGANVPFELFLNPINKKYLFNIMAKTYNKPYEEVLKKDGNISGPVTVELKDDMLTVKGHARKILPTKTRGFCPLKHTFFEASSIRKINGIYYFIYSSISNHELCYATSLYPDHDFIYRGIIISNGDIGYKGITKKKKLNFTGNNHGSIEKINDEYYIFYHRMTHGTDYSRQGCAEKISILDDGSIPQVEMTSCGLNNGPLESKGKYPAYIYSNLTNFHMPHACNNDGFKNIPCMTHENEERFLTNLEKKVWVGYKYFNFCNVSEIEIVYRSLDKAKVIVYNSIKGKKVGESIISKNDSWSKERIKVNIKNGINGLFFYFEGKSKLELLSFEFINKEEKR